MIIKPKIRRSISMSTHPLGCKAEVEKNIECVKKLPKYNGAKKALIIGASSGYGLASRTSLAFNSNADTIGISFEMPPSEKRTGSAGWWNNIWFKMAAAKEGLIAKNFIGDAFGNEMRDQVIKYIKEEFGGKIDLVIYSLASPKRLDPIDGILYSSTLKSTTVPVIGPTINLDNGTLVEAKMGVANEKEIADTIKVMGGEDWLLWIDTLKKAGVLEDGFKTVAYSYCGPRATHGIYKDGTIGAAKRDLEKTSNTIDDLLKDINGEGFVSVNKAFVSKASVFIPLFSLYAASLYKIMKANNTHEDCTQHIYRFFNDMLYGTKREIDDARRLRPDSIEMRKDIQDEVEALLLKCTPENFKEITDYTGIYNEFLAINGFNIDGINYEEDVNMDELSKLTY